MQADSHAARLALFAQDAIEAAQRTAVNEEDPTLGIVNIRIGIASGPVSFFMLCTFDLLWTFDYFEFSTTAIV